MQLDLFEPREPRAEYSVIVTSKRGSAHRVTQFHHGRGTQAGLLGEAKTNAQIDYVPVRTAYGNQLFCIASLMAHNFAREMQMQCYGRHRTTEPKRPALWVFRSLRTLRNHLLLRVGRITRPQNRLTLALALDPDAQPLFQDCMDELDSAA